MVTGKLHVLQSIIRDVREARSLVAKLRIELDDVTMRLKAAITKDEDANIRLNDFMDQCIEFPSNTPDVV